MGKKKSLRSKAVHFVTDLTTGLLNPISDKTSTPSHPPHEKVSESKTSQSETDSISKEDNRDLIDGPDTSSFTAFLYSLLSSSESDHNLNQDEQNDNQEEDGNSSDNKMKENGRRKSLLSRGKQSLRALYQATRIIGNKNQDKGDDSDVKSDNEAKFDGLEMRHIQNVKEPLALGDLPETSEPSLLLTEKTRNALYESLPAIVHGRKWLLLYSLNGSSSFSETYGNPCLAFSEDFEVKEIELWGFVYGSQYEEILSLSKTEMPGICRW